MGGVFGHLAHLYENPNFSFNDLKNILKSAASGELEGTEKTDGYNIYLGYVDGKARAARNKGDMSTGGMDATQIANRKYMGGDRVKDIYVRAFDSYEKALDSLSDEEKAKIFGPNGEVFYNAEIQGYVETEENGKTTRKPLNIINYDENIINIHRLGTKSYDPKSNKLVPVKNPEHSDFLDKVVDKFENDAADTDFKVRRTAFLKLNQLTDDYDLNIALQKIQKAGLVGSKTIGDLLSEKVKEEMDQELGFLDRKIRKQIMNRIFKESGFQSLTQLTKGLPIEIKAQISEFVTKKAPSIVYDALRPIEMAIYDFSLELLRGLQSAYILNSEAETERLSNELKQAVEAIRDYRGERYEDAHAILVKQLEKLKQHEKAITTPLEGFVFQVGDQMYKFTGSFAPANQLLGLFKWGRGKIPPIKVDLSAEEEKLDELVVKEHQEKMKLALIPGGFKPPHKGHLEMVKHYLKEVGENGKVLLFIGSGGKDPRCCGNKPITFEDSERIWEIYFANENMGYPSPNLEIHQVEGGPMGTVVDIVKDHLDPETTEVHLGVGEEDADRWDFMIGNEKYNPKGVTIHTKAFPNYTDAEGMRLRASNMRKAAERGDKELFQSFLPQSSLIATDDILEILGVKIRDEQDKVEEAAHIPMGIFLRLIEEVVEEGFFDKKPKEVKVPKKVLAMLETLKHAYTAFFNGVDHIVYGRSFSRNVRPGSNKVKTLLGRELPFNPKGSSAAYRNPKQFSDNIRSYYDDVFGFGRAGINLVKTLTDIKKSIPKPDEPTFEKQPIDRAHPYDTPEDIERGYRMVQKGADSNQKHTDLMYEKFMNETIKLFNEERQKIKTWQDFVALNNAPPLIGGGTEAKRNQELEKIYKVLPLPIPIEFMETGDVKGFIEHIMATQTGGMAISDTGEKGSLSLPAAGAGGLSFTEHNMFGTGVAYLQDITPPGKRDEEEESKEKEHWRGNLYTMLDTLRHIQGREGEKYENLTDEILARLNDPHPVDVKDEEGNIQTHRWWIEKHYPEDILDEWDVLIAGYTNVEAIKTILKALKRQPPEEELEEISAMGLGSAEMSARKTYKRDDNISKKKKKNLQEDDELIDEIADYLLSKLGV
jgi:hypothetical protein